MSTQKEVAESSRGIFKHLCQQMDRLAKQAISVEEAKAQANLSKQANNLLRYELDRATAIVKFGKDVLELRNIESND